MSNMPEAKKDTRKVDAEAVKRIVDTKGFKVLEEYWKQIKDRSFFELTNPSLKGEELKMWQIGYNQISQWLEIPGLIIKKGEEAIREEEEKVEKEGSASPVKEPKSFMGTNY